MEKADTYTCAVCKETFEKGWCDDEAMEEAEEMFPSIPEDEMELVCDDCYNEMFKR